MFGVSFTEGLLLLIVGLLVLGPQKLPEAARGAARAYAHVKRMINKVQSDLSSEFDLSDAQNSIQSEFQKLKQLGELPGDIKPNHILPNASSLDTQNLPMQGHYFLLSAHSKARRLPKPPRLPNYQCDPLLSSVSKQLKTDSLKTLEADSSV